MYIVTGGCGFIGSNLVHALNSQGIDDILIVDDLEDSSKFVNIRDCKIADYMDKKRFLDLLEAGGLDADVQVIFHQGACADTMETDGRYVMSNNYEYSKILLGFAAARKIPFIYASSAAVYGNNHTTVERDEYERPLNIYGFSKLLFDRHVRRVLKDIESTVVGLRYFNVYGPNESHKGKMASMIYQTYRQLKGNGVVKLFQGTDGYGHGEQLRDFVFVGDVAKVNLFFADGPTTKGIFNVGTGASRCFNDVADILIHLLERGEIAYIPIPDELKGRYQSFTQADVTGLREAGFEDEFTSLECGIARYYQTLEGNPE